MARHTGHHAHAQTRAAATAGGIGRSRADGSGPGPLLGGLAVALALTAGGCSTGPFNQDAERDLRRVVNDAVRRELRDPLVQPEELLTTRQGTFEDLDIPPERLPELNRMAGPQSYNPAEPGVAPLGTDLLGGTPRTALVSLEHAMRSAVANNLEFQFASLAPAISQVQVAQAEAAFDWVLFASVERSWLNDQNLSTGTTLSRNAREVIASRAGLRRALGNGAAFSVQQDITYTRVRQNGTTPRGSQSTSLNWSFQYDQPLLRDFGSDVAQSQVRLARNAERAQIAQLEARLIELTTQVERTYWELWRAHHDLMVLQRLLQRGERIVDVLRARGPAFVNAANLANAHSRVIERRANVLRAQNTLHSLSDTLKRLMNNPALPVGSEILVLPVDRPVDEPVAWSLAESLFTAIERRPEVAQSILSIDDTAIRQLVAANQRLPQLDLRLQYRNNALARGTGDAYETIFESDFPSYVVGLFYEQTIGNRDAEALYARRRLERSQAIISYQNTIQAIANEVKTSIRNVGTFYQLIVMTNLQRLAAAEVLRTLEIQSALLEDITPERLDLELSRHEALALAEQREIESLVQYNIAIAEWFAAQGTALDRNRIDFVVPSVAESLHWPYLPTESAGYARDWWQEHTAGWNQDAEAGQGGPPAGGAPAQPPSTGDPAAPPPGEGDPSAAALPPEPAPAEEPTMFPIQPAATPP